MDNLKTGGWMMEAVGKGGDGGWRNWKMEEDKGLGEQEEQNHEYNYIKF